MKLKKIIILNLTIFLTLMMSHSVFATTTLSVDSGGQITLDKSDDSGNDKTNVLCQKDCSVTVVEKDNELVVTNEKNNKFNVERKGKQNDSLVCSQADSSKDINIAENGVIVKKGTEKYKQLIKKCKQLKE